MSKNINKARKAAANKQPVKTIEMEDVNVFEFGAYETPKGVEDASGEFVRYGDANDHDSYLMGLYEDSTTNNACINTIVSLIYGKGLKIRNAKYAIDDLLELKTILKPSDVRRIVFDYYALGRAAIQVVYKSASNAGTKKKKKFAKLAHFPVTQLRPIPKNKDGEIEGYAYCPDWSEYKPGETKLETFPAYKNSKKKTKKHGNGESQWLVIQPYCAGHEYFSPVKYNGGLNWADLEVQMADYALTEVDGGFSPGYVVNFPGQGRSSEAKAQLNSTVQTKLTGARGQRVITGFFDDADDKVSVEAIPQIDNTNKISGFLKESKIGVYKAHRLPPILTGDYTEEKGMDFSDQGSQIKTAYSWVQAQIVSHNQDELLEALEEVMIDNGIVSELYFEQKDPFLPEATPQPTSSEEEPKEENKDTSAEEMWKEDAEKIEKEGGLTVYDRFE